MHAKGQNIVAHESAESYEAAIDRLVDKLERQIERYRDKRTQEPRRARQRIEQSAESASSRQAGRRAAKRRRSRCIPSIQAATGLRPVSPGFRDRRSGTPSPPPTRPERSETKLSSSRCPTAVLLETVGPTASTRNRWRQRSRRHSSAPTARLPSDADEHWAVGASAIETVRLDPNPRGDDLELVWDGSARRSSIDGMPADPSSAPLSSCSPRRVRRLVRCPRRTSRRRSVRGLGPRALDARGPDAFELGHALRRSSREVPPATSGTSRSSLQRSRLRIVTSSIGRCRDDAGDTSAAR